MELGKIVIPLVEWYLENKRTLPWREDVNPYRTWVSEIMLQQTRVEAVKVYFERFMGRLPTIYDLAEIQEGELLKLWEGLGYYNRVRNMQKMAILVVEKYHGVIPSDYDTLISLPGIGDYTAGAILSIACHQRIPCVDGNVLRVVTRVMGSFLDITLLDTRKKIRSLLMDILPYDASDFNQALMELGALVCIPNGKPLCYSCPIQHLCVSKKEGLIGEIPVKTPKKKRRIEDYTVFLITYQKQMMLRKRDEDGLLAGLYELPNVRGALTIEEAKDYVSQLGLFVLGIKKRDVKKHIFTHVEWNMLLYQVEVMNDGGFLFVTEEERKHIYPLPSAFEKLLR